LPRRSVWGSSVIRNKLGLKKEKDNVDVKENLNRFGVSLKEKIPKPN